MLKTRAYMIRFYYKDQFIFFFLNSYSMSSQLCPYQNNKHVSTFQFTKKDMLRLLKLFFLFFFIHFLFCAEWIKKSFVMKNFGWSTSKINQILSYATFPFVCFDVSLKCSPSWMQGRVVRLTNCLSRLEASLLDSACLSTGLSGTLQWV